MQAVQAVSGDARQVCCQRRRFIIVSLTLEVSGYVIFVNIYFLWVAGKKTQEWVKDYPVYALGVGEGENGSTLLYLYVGEHVKPKQPCGETCFIQQPSPLFPQ